MPQLMPAARVELARFADHLGFNVTGEGEVHVIAAEHQVFPYRKAVEAQALVPSADGNDREIRGASAYVADQNHLTFLHPAFPVGFVLRKPGIKGREGFLDEYHPGQTRIDGGGHGELPGDFIEGSRYGEDDQLFFEAIAGSAFGDGFIPDFPQVLQVTGAGLDRRNLVHIGSHRPGQDGGGAVHAAMAEP